MTMKGPSDFHLCQGRVLGSFPGQKDDTEGTGALPRDPVPVSPVSVLPVHLPPPPPTKSRFVCRSWCSLEVTCDKVLPCVCVDDGVPCRGARRVSTHGSRLRLSTPDPMSVYVYIYIY